MMEVDTRNAFGLRSTLAFKLVGYDFRLKIRRILQGSGLLQMHGYGLRNLGESAAAAAFQRGIAHKAAASLDELPVAWSAGNSRQSA